MNANYATRYSLILFFILITSYSSSQTIKWQRTYPGPSGGYDYRALCLCKSNADNYFLFIYDEMNYKYLFYKLNGFGDSLFSKIIVNRSAKTCASSGDGGAVVTGGTGRPISVKIDYLGNTVWDSLYLQGLNNTNCNYIIKTKDGFYIMGGGAQVIKLDNVGRFIWQKHYPFTFKLDYQSIVEAVDGGYILGGITYDYVGSPDYGILTKIDTSGNKIWEKRYSINEVDGGIHNFRVARINNSYVAGGYEWEESYNRHFLALLYTDSDGNVQDTVKHSFFNTSNYLLDFKSTFDNKSTILTFLRIKDNMDSTLSSALIIDDKGNIKERMEYSGTSFTYLNYIATPDSNTIMFVGTSNHINKYKEYPFVVRTDTTLYAPPVSVRNISSAIPDNLFLKQNYPNPFNNSTKIIFGIRKKGIYSLKIYNTSGKLIKELLNQYFDVGEYETIFKADYLSSGVYFYKLETQNQILTKKLVLLK